MALFPEPDGLMSFGGDGGGGVYYWSTADSDPDRWTVLVGGRAVLEQPGVEYDCGLAEYIAGLTNGSIESESLEDWPRENPQFRSG